MAAAEVSLLAPEPLPKRAVSAAPGGGAAAVLLDSVRRPLAAALGGGAPVDLVGCSAATTVVARRHGTATRALLALGARGGTRAWELVASASASGPPAAAAELEAGGEAVAASPGPDLLAGGVNAVAFASRGAAVVEVRGADVAAGALRLGPARRVELPAGAGATALNLSAEHLVVGCRGAVLAARLLETLRADDRPPRLERAALPGPPADVAAFAQLAPDTVLLGDAGGRLFVLRLGGAGPPRLAPVHCSLPCVTAFAPLAGLRVALTDGSHTVHVARVPDQDEDGGAVRTDTEAAVLCPHAVLSLCAVGQREVLCVGRGALARLRLARVE